MAPLANSFTMGCRHGHGCRLSINHPPHPGVLKVAMVSPDKIVTKDRMQTYDEMPAPVRLQHALANWTSVRLGNNPNRPTVNERETEQFHSMTDSTGPQNRVSGQNRESYDAQSTDSELIYSDYSSEHLEDLI